MKKKTIFFTVFPAILLSFAFFSCRLDDNHDNNSVLLYEYVYVSGYYEGVSNDVACYWMDDASTRTDLFDTANARAQSIFVSEGDIYVAGYFTNSQPNNAAGYWKNGTLVELYNDTTGTTSARASAIFVDGSDVYAAGYIDEVSKAVGYWKNGTWVKLYDTSAAEATDIFVSGSDIYVSGFYESGIYNYSCYWKNGALINLYTADYSEAYAISVSGTDVYVAGYYFDGVVNACYWKNDSAGVSSPLNSSAAYARDIVVSGSDVYVTGYYTNAQFKNVACYWVNDSSGQVDLYNDAVNQAQAHGIYVYGGDVYVAGYVDEGTQSACYWKNGTRTDLSTSGKSSGYSLLVAY